MPLTRRPTPTLVALILVSAIGCAHRSACDTSGPCVNPAPVVIELGQDFDLAPAQLATLKGTIVTVSFSQVAADSRCPTDVTCVWAGDAAAQLRVDLSDAELWSGELHTTLTPRAAAAGSYELTLLGVSPSPRSGSTIKPTDYRVRLRLTAK